MNNTDFKLGVLLPTRGLLLADQRPDNIEPVLALARRVEESGLDSVWVGDSLTAKPRLEPLSTLSAIAAQTHRIRLGTAVMLMGLRHPLLLAQTLATVDLISQGRLVIAAGIGGAFNEAQRDEWESVLVKPSTRARRLEEILQILNGLENGERFSFHGRHFDLDNAVMLPLPTRPSGVPILLACHGRSSARDIQIGRAARLGDGIISISDTPSEFRDVVSQFYETVVNLGKDVHQVQTTMYMTINMDEDRAIAEADAEEWLLGYYGANIWGDRWGPFGGSSQVIERIQEYRDAGAQTVIVRFASFNVEQQLESFLSKVAPVFA
ncbi:MAG: LLM class flavin-dependent oxidoreductase [Chloroflexota bacterium]|nr:LLM class flavin-dependent oxidoreductase [Chloroflexota bacterium]